MNEFDLRFKYRDPANVPVRRNGTYKGRTGNSTGVTPKRPRDKQGLGPRRRQGIGAVTT